MSDQEPPSSQQSSYSVISEEDGERERERERAHMFVVVVELNTFSQLLCEKL